MNAAPDQPTAAAAPPSATPSAAPHSWAALLRTLLLGPGRGLPESAAPWWPAVVEALAQAVAEGHTCLALGALPKGALPSAWPGWPGAAEALRRCPAIGAPESHPLVLDGEGRLYLQRFYRAEVELAEALLGLAGAVPNAPAPAAIEGALAQLFPGAPEGPGTQRAAVRQLLAQRLVLLTGGPGTGKTYTLARALAAELNLRPGAPLRVALAAPTGKAAMRLAEVLAEARAQWPAAWREATAAWPREGQTLHRLLGASADGLRWHYGPGRHLPYDWVLVDEASMLDLRLAHRLAQALAPGTRLVLVGDTAQLSSVDPGAVLADLVAAAPLRATVAELNRGHRQQAGSRLSQLLAAVREGKVDETLALLEEPLELDAVAGRGVAEVVWHPPGGAALRAWANDLREAWPAVVAGARQRQPSLALAAAQQWRTLCATHDGPLGVRRLNELAEATLAHDDWLTSAGGGHLAPGLPLLSTRNDYAANIYNGDQGVVLADGLVHFSEVGGQHRAVAPARLGATEPAWALTIHRAQGSEYGAVWVFLPPAGHPLLRRELLYTALSRARRRLHLVATRDALVEALGATTSRTTGLVARLRREG